MAVSASGLYRLAVEELRELCVERGLDSSGPVRSLRRRLVDHIKSDQMDGAEQDRPVVQASVPTDLGSNGAEIVPPTGVYSSHGGGEDGQAMVLVELLRQVSPLRSEEPEDILRLFVRFGEIYDLGIVEDRGFIMRIMPLDFGSLLKFLGDCVREGGSWADCKSRLLDEYFPYFVRERLIRDVIVFNFQGEEQSLRAYIDQIFQAADILRYGATEQQLVDRFVTNFHPRVLSQAALLDRPSSRKDLQRLVTLIEEKCSVARERQRVGIVSKMNEF